MKTCETCGSVFTLKVFPSGQREATTRFAERRFCSSHCANGYANPTPTPVERFMRKVQVDANGCWLWTAATNGKYAKFYVGCIDGKKKLEYAHRWSYSHFVGQIPEGLQIDHLCRVVTCVNPKHLEPVTCQENLLRRPPETAARPNLYEIHERRRLAHTHTHEARPEPVQVDGRTDLLTLIGEPA